eukprot:TRINITY_DN28700_c0_g2_i1.p1 TRINITY_DN28700_c0_g2~~TRINITY_DN28700_c0_g2_i1.p1  ORF type:complete len:413 (-),score=109.15 TRINITY_DN28700_c0_g2_i1:72-1310(-)
MTAKALFPPRLLASVGLAVLLALVMVTAAWAAIEDQCDSEHCGGQRELLSTDGQDRESEDAASFEQLGEEVPVEAAEEPSNETSSNATLHLKREVPTLGAAKVSVLLGFCGLMVLWIIATIKWAVDGSLPARLAIWGLLPEAYAAITVRAVAALMRLKSGTLPVVMLRGCVTDSNAGELAEAIRAYGKKSDLQALELPYNRQLGEEGLKVLVDVVLQSGHPLEELDISYNPQLGDAATSVLRPLIEAKSSKLDTLRLADCGLRSSSLTALVACASRSRLKTLDLSGNALAGCGEQLVEVLEAPLLEEIALACCGLELEDVVAVAEQLPYTSLRSVQLAGNAIGAAGLEVLSQHLPSCQVDELGLEGNELKADDLHMLGTAWAKRPFSRLKLSGNPMSQEEVARFIQALRSMQ